MLRHNLITSLLLAAVAAPALAQDKAAAAVPFVLDAGSIEVKALIDKAAAHLGWNILSNPQ